MSHALGALHFCISAWHRWQKKTKRGHQGLDPWWAPELRSECLWCRVPGGHNYSSWHKLSKLITGIKTWKTSIWSHLIWHGDMVTWWHGCSMLLTGSQVWCVIYRYIYIYTVCVSVYVCVYYAYINLPDGCSTYQLPQCCSTPRLRLAGEDALDDNRIRHHHHRAWANDLQKKPFLEPWTSENHPLASYLWVCLKMLG